MKPPQTSKPKTNNQNRKANNKPRKENTNPAKPNPDNTGGKDSGGGGFELPSEKRAGFERAPPGTCGDRVVGGFLVDAGVSVRHIDGAAVGRRVGLLHQPQHVRFSRHESGVFVCARLRIAGTHALGGGEGEGAEKSLGNCFHFWSI